MCNTVVSCWFPDSVPLAGSAAFLLLGQENALNLCPLIYSSIRVLVHVVWAGELGELLIPVAARSSVPLLEGEFNIYVGEAIKCAINYSLSPARHYT